MFNSDWPNASIAFDHVGAHNVEWAGVPIEWNESFEDCNRIQRLVSWNLMHNAHCDIRN